MAASFTLLATDSEHPIQGVCAVSESRVLVTIQNRGAELWEIFDQKCVSSWSQDISTTWTSAARPIGNQYVGVLDDTWVCVWKESNNRVTKLKHQVKKPIFQLLTDPLLGDYILTVFVDGAIGFFHKDLDKDSLRKFPPKALRLRGEDRVLWADLMVAPNSPVGIYALVLIDRGEGGMFLHAWEIPPLVQQPKRKRISTARLMEGNTTPSLDVKALNRTSWLGRWQLHAPPSSPSPSPLLVSRHDTGLCMMWSDGVWERLCLPIGDFDVLREAGKGEGHARAGPVEPRGQIKSASFCYAIADLGVDGGKAMGTSALGSGERGSIVPAEERMLWPGHLAACSHGSMLAIAARLPPSPSTSPFGRAKSSHVVSLWDMQYGVKCEEEALQAEDGGDDGQSDDPRPLAEEEGVVGVTCTTSAVCVALRNHVLVWAQPPPPPSLAQSLGGLSLPITAASASNGLRVGPSPSLQPQLAGILNLEALVMEHDLAGGQGGGSSELRGPDVSPERELTAESALPFPGIEGRGAFARPAAAGLRCWKERVGGVDAELGRVLQRIEEGRMDSSAIMVALERFFRLNDGRIPRQLQGKRKEKDRRKEKEKGHAGAGGDHLEKGPRGWVRRNVLMGERVAVGAARVCLLEGYWTPLRWIIESRLLGFQACPLLLPTLLEHEKLSLIEACLRHMPDIGEAALVQLLQFFLTDSSDRTVAAYFASRAPAPEPASAQEGRLKLLNFVLWHESDPLQLGPWLAVLTPSEVKGLCEQLFHWLHWYAQKGSLVVSDRRTMLQAELVVPSEQQVIAWLAALMQTHVAELVMVRDYHPMLREVALWVGQKVEWCKERAAFLGFVDEWERRLHRSIRSRRANSTHARLSRQLEVPEYAIEVLAM